MNGRRNVRRAVRAIGWLTFADHMRYRARDARRRGLTELTASFYKCARVAIREARRNFEISRGER